MTPPEHPSWSSEETASPFGPFRSLFSHFSRCLYYFALSFRVLWVIFRILDLSSQNKTKKKHKCCSRFTFTSLPPFWFTIPYDLFSCTLDTFPIKVFNVIHPSSSSFFTFFWWIIFPNFQIILIILSLLLVFLIYYWHFGFYSLFSSNISYFE